eukprot:jgi/Chrzof1/10607/Cz05g05010.t1
MMGTKSVMVLLVIVAAVGCLLSTSHAAPVTVPVPAACRAKVTLERSASHYLAANVSTVHWGYYYKNLKPNLVVSSGDTMTVEMLTHHGGDDYDKMVKGDKAMEGVFEWTSTKLGTPMRGATGKGDGSHIMTGPIYVCGAAPGDVLQIDILDLTPRVNPTTGKTYGANSATGWGYQFSRAPYKTGKKREVTTLYEIVKDSSGKAVYLKPDYSFVYGNVSNYKGPLTPSCIPKSGKVRDSYQNDVWTNPGYIFRTLNVPCVNGKQQFVAYSYPGLIVKHPTGTENYNIRGKFKVAANFHIGNIGLAPNYESPVTSVPPTRTGGNIDNRRIGAGASLYLPVEVAGAYLSMGDAHASQGDSEFDGTAIETSINAKLKLTLHKKGKLPKKVQGLDFPLLENANEYIVHGYAIKDYLRDLPNPQVTVFARGANLSLALTNTYINARDWLMSAQNLTEDEAITLITVTCDFHVTQVVDGNWGMHLIIPKYVFDKADTGAYKPKVVCGSSRAV